MIRVICATVTLSFCLFAVTGRAAEPAANPTHIDFSYAGYRAGEAVLPTVAGAIAVRPSGGDDTDLLQSAINHVAAMPLDVHGFRGAVVLRAGRFRLAGQLHLNASGVVLRGSGVANT